MVGKDGDIGKVRDAFFEDDTWNIRYLVVATGDWLQRRRVLLSPAALEPCPHRRRVLKTDLTRETIAAGPRIDLSRPPTRTERLELAAHYGWMKQVDRDLTPDWPRPGLSSFQRVSGYRVDATDGKVGAVEDFILDDKRWDVRYLVVRSERAPKKPVWVAPRCIETRDRSERTLEVGVPRSALRSRTRETPWQAKA